MATTQTHPQKKKVTDLPHWLDNVIALVVLLGLPIVLIAMAVWYDIFFTLLSGAWTALWNFVLNLVG